ncbi:DNA repair protein RadC [candidate division WWE3 bacterium]|nr:DNA repair protein RadC [candidate division WWE3 bacterium]
MPRIRDMDKTDRPRERLVIKNAASLSNAELLAIVLRSGGQNNSALMLSQVLLKEFGGLKGFFDASLEQLISVKDIGLTKAVTLKAVCELALRIDAGEEEERLGVKNPGDVFKVVRKDLFAQKREHLYILSLDTRNVLLSKDLVSVGTVNETLVHPREVFRQALLRNAVSIILVHNHPSGDPTPSNDDILLTDKIAKAGKDVGIALVDHVVVCDDSFISIKGMKLFDVYKFDSEGGDSR